MRNSLRLLAGLLAFAAPAAAQPFVGVVCTDYVTGKFSVCEADVPWTATPDVATIHSDAVGRAHGGRVYIVNRLGADNLQVLDPAQDFATLHEFSTGTATNPQGVAFSPDGSKAYLPRQNADDVLVMDPETGEWLDTIDLSAWADADGSCEVGDCIAVGDRLFVAILRLNRNLYWTPVGDSYLAVIDMTTDTLVDCAPGTPGVQAIALAGKNPSWELSRAGELILCSCVGFYGLADGGVELVDPAALASLGYCVTESALGGDVGDAVWVSETRAYAIVTDTNGVTRVKAFNPSTGGGVWVVAPGTGYVYTDMELDAAGELFLADRTPGAEGLRVYLAETGEALGHRIPVGLAPFDVVMPAAGTAAETPPALLARLDVWPNPFNPAVTLSVELPAAGPLALRIFDALGKPVATLAEGVQPAGRREFVWRPEGLASGVYLARAETAAGAASARLVMLK
ncbi:T9SS type A sorting domain-containing protein [bacterium]|nr:T9SS type A sorting domain-containing protein [bacterium]